MPGNIPLTSERGRQLRNLHPLYTRLSGDVIWALFEEAGLDQEACGRAMDETIAQMHAVLDVMDRLERGEADYLGIVAQDAGNRAGVSDRCAACTALSGMAVSTEFPGWRNYLPPYAIGCKAACVALTTDALDGYCTGLEHTPRPSYSLLCPLVDK